MVVFAPHAGAAQVPWEQIGVEPEHAVPQVPQLLASVFVLTSQPLAAFPSQSAYPTLHENPQLPPVHVGPAFATAGQTFPQLPQLLASLCFGVSQPLAAFLSQSAYPALHTNPQLPPPHAGVAFVTVGQAFMHAPQFRGSLLRFVQTPGALPQAVSDAGHAHPVLVHMPPVAHVVPALPPEAPHPPVAPQYVALLVGSMQDPPQATSLPGQLAVQWPLPHTVPDGHATPALPASPTPQPALAPQCWGSEAGSTHLPPQLTSVPGQDTEQAPALHTSPEGQSVPALPASPTPQAPLAPQYWLSRDGSMHTPLQLISEPGQMTEHLPLLHALPAGHTVPQAPQWLVSVCSFTHSEVAPPSTVGPGQFDVPPPHWVAQ
jgi:hypothetical protein